mmetsp:Transcript_94601/g.262814  ORF Transcript_94601/g.262814 Transcript_94601/m.262814 type:complete len:99 (-) Transcript_94601:594-890(-)
MGTRSRTGVWKTGACGLTSALRRCTRPELEAGAANAPGAESSRGTFGPGEPSGALAEPLRARAGADSTGGAATAALPVATGKHTDPCAAFAAAPSGAK